MRDLFEDMFTPEPIDPVAAAQRAVRPQRLRRFYERVEVALIEDGHAVRLDGRPVRTPARAVLALPTAALAEAIATEWREQTEFIDPPRMPLTRLANTIIDGVVHAVAEVSAEVTKYLASDLLVYRAEGPDSLLARQSQHWDPVLAWAAESFGARFMLAQGVVFVPQTEEAVAAMRSAIPAEPWRLAAVHAATTLTGSALLALALASGRFTFEDIWAAAHVDEDWNMDQWGRDSLALERRSARAAEMRAAATVLALGP
jgi:chaperone required for assembly of F1-ATPase